MEAAQHKTVTRPATARPTPAAVPVVQAARAGVAQFQRVLRVSSPRDPGEREAESTATKIMRMAESPYVARFAGAIGQMQRRAAAIARRADGASGPELIARRADGGSAGGDITSGIVASGSGAPLPTGVRSFMEPRFGADFSGVRVHTGDRAAQLSRQVSAQAFTVGNQIFFGRDQFRPETHDGKALIAHELTHTIQQGAVQQGGPAASSASQAGGTVQRREDVTVTETAAPQVQRLGISDALNYFADAANNIPGYRMFTIILGVNPINMNRVDRSAANILRAIVEFIPGGGLIVQALDAYGVFERAGQWIEQQLASLGISGASIREAINRFLDTLGWRDIFQLGDVWNRARRIFSEPIDRIIAFVRSLGAQILRMIKDAILRPLAGLASQTRGWDLLCAVLGYNPITGEAVPRTAETLIGGFMRLIGQEELWQNIQRANALGRAWTWFQGALSGLMGFVRQIPQLFLQALQALEIADIVLLPRAFARVASVFGNFIGNFLSWAGNTVWNLLEIIFEVVAPSVMVYLRRAASAFRTILRDPIGFVRNLMRAAMQGFRQFAANFLTHLRASLIGWLTGAMSGANIYIPQGFTLREILKFVLSVLGLTWQNIRQKLVRAVGETAVRVLETGFDIVVTLVTQGPAAAWEKIQETLTNLREMVIEQIMTFVRDRVVTAAVTRLLSMLSPVGAFIQAIIAIYNTVMFFVERLRQIAQVAAAFIDSIAAIASGVIDAAANRVEQTMAGLLTLVISFLARIAGLGRVTDAVTSVIDRVRQPIDRALDRVVEWIVNTARRLGRLIAQGARSVARRVANWWAERRQMQLGDGQSHTLRFLRSGRGARLMLASEEMPVQDHLQEAIRGNALDDAAKARAREALQFFNDNIAPVTTQPLPDAPPPPLQAKIDALPDNLNQFAAKLAAIGQDTNVALPAVVWNPAGPHSSGVELLTNRTSRGGQDARSGNPKGWALIVARGLTRDKGNWVRMHMVTAGVGGQDIDTNLLPAPTAVNTGGVVRGFERQVERILYGDTPASEVRAARSLFKRLTQRNAVIWIETTSRGFWPAYTDPVSRATLHDATTFATKVSFKAGMHFPRNNDWAKDPTPVVQAEVGIPEPSFTGTYQPNINEVGEPEIARQAGIDANLAREIVAERGGTPAKRPFPGPAEFATRMRDHRTASGVRVTPEFLSAINAVIRAVAQSKLKWS